MPAAKTSEFIFKFLRKNNAKNIFLVPGGGNMYLTDAVKRNKSLKYTNFFHEQSAAIAAESYSRSKNNLGVALVTSGPGSTNALTAVVGAWIESVPLIVISGQVKRDDLKKNKDIRQNGPQEVDIINSVKNYTKFSILLKEPNSVKKVINKAVKEAISGRPGPVWIDIPLDVQAKIIKYKKNDIYKVERKVQKKKLDIKKISNLIQKSKRPIILAGHGIRLSNSKTNFLKFLNLSKIPVLTTWNCIDLLENDHYLNFGSPGVVAKRYSNLILQKSDLIISIGSSLNQIIVAFNEKDFGRNAKKIIIDIDKNQLKKLKIPNSTKINICASDFLKKISNFYSKKNLDYSEWVTICANIRKKFDNEFVSKNISKKLNINHYNFVNTLSEVLEKNQIISTGSSGLGIEILYTHFKTKKNQRMFLTSGLGSMGYGLPSAIGTCLSNQNKKIVLIESDGSFMFNIQELATIKSYNLPIKIILLNNSGYASIRSTHKNYFNNRYVGTGNEDGIKYPDFKIISNGFQIPHYRLKNQSELNTKLRKYIYSSGPGVIEVMLKKDEKLKPKVSSFISENGRIKSMPIEDLSPLLDFNELKKILGDTKVHQNSIIMRNTNNKKR